MATLPAIKGHLLASDLRRGFVRLRGRALTWAATLFWPVLALAAIVTAADVTAAVQASRYANAFLQAHAAEIGALSLMVENRSGDTTSYNGSCCYGVLQLNTANIIAAGYTVSQYRYASLQTQVDAWARIQSQALQDPVIGRLQNMSTFDGQPVDASLLLACVQLGQGNCRTMINSGSCSGFRDSNGTTICSMAAAMRAAVNGTGAPPPPVGGTGGGYQPRSTGTNVAPDQAFASGSGVSMDNSSQSIRLVVAALALIWLTWGSSATWGQFTGGKLAVYDMTELIARGMVVVLLVLWLVT